MEMTKVIKPFIRRGWTNTFGNIVYVDANEPDWFTNETMTVLHELLLFSALIVGFASLDFL